MRYRPLGRTGLTVSEIGYGCAGWWGKPAFPERQAAALVHTAIELGINLFDTGASYSAGEAQARLGRALKGRDVSRLVVATKAGTFREGRRMRRDFTPAAIRASAEDSLRVLGLETLPVLQLHGPALTELNDDLLEALAGLKASGLVRAVGVNSFDPGVAWHAAGLAEIDLVMIDYNLLRPERAQLVARAAAAGKGVLAGMPLAMGHIGLNTLKITAPRDLWYAARAVGRHPRDVAEGFRFGFMNRLDGMTGAQAALAHVLADPGVSSAVVGATRMAHLKDDVAASEMVLQPWTAARIAQAQAALRRRR
jgi:aryl-alcohol dehydrogenase-like predicted oxidoreductase